MRKIKLIYLSLLAFVFACGQTDTKVESKDVQVADVNIMAVDTVDTLVQQKEKMLITADAMLDGPEEELYVYMPEKSEIDLDLVDFDTLHIVPDGNYSDRPNNEVEASMIAMIRTGFKLYPPFNEGNKLVEVFYCRDKSKKMMTYNCIDGLPNGSFTVYEPDGEIYIQRNYENGVWQSSEVEPFAVDWSFDQESSSLEISDFDRAQYMLDSVQVVTLFPSLREGQSNALYTLIEKKSFENIFLINNQPFTGKLMAYSLPVSVDEDRVYFELNFVNGLLDGHVIINNEWGGLNLHEIFTEGQLDSTVFKQEEYGDGVAKPIIYLYPEQEQIVEVSLNFNGHLTHTYPKYNNGWKVLAKPDGTLFDKSKKEYYALYWEGQANNDFTISEGFVVEGKKTVSFLEDALATLGLNRKEANEFIIYWLPQLEQNPYNLIHFSTTEYEQMAKLNISPQPETLIRVMMVFKPLQTKIDVPKQDLSRLKKERKGFTVVEWGGKKLSPNTKIIL
ncbi:MAG: hypothetical protein ACWA41_03650 [Putridiphycobacter sp.]